MTLLSRSRGSPATTCATLRRPLCVRPGCPPELAAERLGHADGGALLPRTYRHVRAGETHAALDAIGYGLRAAPLDDEWEQRAGVR